MAGILAIIFFALIQIPFMLQGYWFNILSFGFSVGMLTSILMFKYTNRTRERR